MTESELKNIEFYKEQYLLEHERGRFYDSVIQYPTTLLIVFIGGAFYSFNNYFIDSAIALCLPLDWIFIILLGLFSLITLIAIYFLARVFHGSTRSYLSLPFAEDLLNHEKSIYKYHYKYSEKNSYKEKRNDAKNNTCDNFSNTLKTYYIQLTEINQRTNNKRADFYYYTKTFLFIDLILLIAIGIIGFLN